MTAHEVNNTNNKSMLQIMHAVMISDWEVSGRYDIHFSIRINTLEKFHEIIYDWYKRLYASGIR